MNEIKPLKRSLQLQPLSREHHDGLLFVWKIRQGLTNNTDIEKLRQFVGWFWENHMRPHFFQEEKILMPWLPDLHPLASKLKSDHNEIRELVISIDKEVDQYDLKDLANLVEVHIRWEEREFFQFLESTLSVKELDKVSEELNQHPVTCQNEWKDEFWVQKKSDK
ncbi:hypothetical protein CAP36_11585 [Chitinophagaceae bacterium IBVUCB2]|nr:hypothetical protein CAP36_11585 [Chitinophagaceae bacterium IBVUCB2]